MPIDLSDISDLKSHIGQPLGTSNWYKIDQESIDAFGEVTRDTHAMHMDKDWAQNHGPFGQTIAFGFQTLSMLTTMVNDIVPRGTDEAYKLNYGFDRVRFMAPVKVGAHIRATATLGNVRERSDGSAIVSVKVKVEIEGEEKLALAATWLFLITNNITGQPRPTTKD